MNINSATQAELETLPGIGPVKARRIIELRRQKGRFSRVEELEEAYGIGPKTVEALRPLCCVRDAPRQTVSSATPPAPDVQGVQSVRCWKCSRIFSIPADKKKGTCPFCGASFTLSR